jgi:hypothetical protein
MELGISDHAILLMSWDTKRTYPAAPVLAQHAVFANTVN